MKAIADVVSVIATIATLSTNITTVYAMYYIWKQRSTVNFLLLPYVVMFAAAVLWALYGAMTNTFSVELGSCVGVIFNLAYIILYVRFAQNQTQPAYQVFAGALGLIFFLMYFRRAATIDATAAVSELGLVCDIITVVQFLAPLSALGEVIRTKSSEIIPMALVSVNFVVSGLWWFYGYLLEDSYIIFPNMIGCFFAFIQVTICFIYPRRPANAVQNNGNLIGQA